MLYLFFIIVIGMPLLCAEFALGRDSRSNALDAFVSISGKKGWGALGVLGIVTSIMIFSFYSVVAGWTLEYGYLSVSRGFESSDVSELHRMFNEFIASPWMQLGCTWLFVAVNCVVLMRGVRAGIEKLSNFLMPLLFLLLIIFCVNSLMLPGAKAGLDFLFAPDFSMITPRLVVSAMGQAFFSLSLGLGCMLTYGSYFKETTNIPRTTATIISLDTLVALMSGVIIFPAVFSFGMSPQAGPTLVFETLPSIFGALPGGNVFATLFFVLLFIASLTSTVSMAEISISFFNERFGISRRGATLLTCSIAFVLSGLCALSFGPLSNFTIASFTIFNFFDFTASNILLPVGGFFTAIFAGWVYSRDRFGRQLGQRRDDWLVKTMQFLLRYLIPAMLVLILIS